jgi:hypothetical protein
MPVIGKEIGNIFHPIDEIYRNQIFLNSKISQGNSIKRKD